MQCNGDMRRAYEYTHNRMSPGCMATLGGGAPLVTPHANFQLKGGSKSSLLIDTSNAAGLAVSRAFRRRNLPHVLLERPDPDSMRINTASASPLIVLGMAEFDGFMLKNKRDRVRFRARVVEHLPAGRLISMREIDALSNNILMRKK